MNKTSTNAPGIVAQTLAALCIILFVITALIVLLLFNVERRAFDAATYKRALVNENFYQQFPALMGDIIAKNLGNDAPPFTKQMNAANWAVFVENLLSPQQLQAMTEDSIAQFFGYLNGDIETPHISLVPLKQSLAGPNGLNAALTIIKSQPDCSLQQLALMATSFGQVLCNPPEKILEVISPIVQTELQALAAAIPDQVQMVNANANPQRVQNLKTFRLIIRLSPLIPLALLLMITLLAVRSFRGWLNWWGWPLLLTGLPGAIIGFAGAPLFRRIMERIIAVRIPIDMPQEMLDAVNKVIDASLREMLRPAGWEGLFLFIAGLLMVLLAAFLANREKYKRSQAETNIFYK
jgi:hypothetical protein